MEYQAKIRQLGKPGAFSGPWHNGVVLRSTNWLGDALMTLPAAYQLSRLKPAACGFFVVAPRGVAALWRACPWVDAVIEMEGKRISRKEAREVHRFGAGVGVVFPNSFGSALDLFRCGIPFRLGRRGRFRSLLLSRTLPEWKRMPGIPEFHQLSYYFELVSALGEIDCTTEYPSLRADSARAAALGLAGGDVITLAPGAAYGPAKQWPAEHFLAVARRAQSMGFRIAIVGTGKEKEVASWLEERLPGSVNLAGCTTLEELMSALAASKAVVANDSGAMHLAAALGTRGVAIFGSTDPVGTGPIGAPWRFLASAEPCRPCFGRECALGDYRCLKGITPEAVITELEAILD